MTQIIQYDGKGENILRSPAKEVPISEVTSPKFREIVRKMKEALMAEEDGVAIAAPQVGEPWRIIIVSKRVSRDENGEGETSPDGKDIVLINPVITKSSKKKKWVEEGCLSMRFLYGRVRRADKVSVRAFGENGRLLRRGASGLLAQIFQHEIDHLDGIIFTDKAKDIIDMPPAEKGPAAKI
ncbi:MAG: peptide deformylase [Candidatus Taylorbacteria bacterium]|nr:peptide deformylase [Candidatus Taylorbacteria bacterium]